MVAARYVSWLDKKYKVIADEDDYKKYIKTNDKYKRPTEVPALLGDNSKILKTLNWKPKISYKQMIKEMLINDLREYANLTGTDEDILIKAKQLMKEKLK